MSDRAPLLAGSQQTYSSTDATSDSNTITPSSPSSHSLTKPPPSDPTSPQHFNLHNLSRWDFNWILVGLWGACFLGALDTTIVATLLTAIGSSFEKSHMASWLGSSYLLSVCCFTPVYGVSRGFGCLVDCVDRRERRDRRQFALHLSFLNGFQDGFSLMLMIPQILPPTASM